MAVDKLNNGYINTITVKKAICKLQRLSSVGICTSFLKVLMCQCEKPVIHIARKKDTK